MSFCSQKNRPLAARVLTMESCLPTIPKDKEKEDDEAQEERNSRTKVPNCDKWGDVILNTPATYVQFRTDNDDMDDEEDELITHQCWKVPPGRRHTRKLKEINKTTTKPKRAKSGRDF